jgi:hypothetical protein
MRTNNKVMAGVLALALCGVLALAGRVGVANAAPGYAVMPLVRHVLPGVWAGMKVGAYAVGMLGGRH